MKKRYLKGLSIVLSSAMILTTIAGCNVNTDLLKKDAKEEVVTDVLTQTVKPANIASGETDKVKEETVYVFTNANGSQKSILVNEKLSNPNALKNIEDETTLTELVNLSGDEDYSKLDNGVNWNANGNAITYQGTTDKNAPVTIKATYYLDGKETAPENLAGKSGKVKIKFDYTNNEKREVEVNGEKKDMYVPFTVVTGMLLPADTFSNIEVTNGKVTQVGNDSLAVGIVLPGMKDSLSSKLDDLDIDMDIPDSFEVTMDAKDFKLDTVISVVTANISADIDMGEIDTTSIEDKVDELKDAGDKLSDGTDKLAEGTQKLADNIPDLVNGAGDLEKGAKDLKDGANKIKDGVGAYTQGVDAAADGAKKIDEGTASVNTAVTALNNNMKEKIVPGLAQIKAGMEQLTSGLVAALEQGKTDAVTKANQGLAESGITYDDIDNTINDLNTKKAQCQALMMLSDDEAANQAVAAQIKAQNENISDDDLAAALQNQLSEMTDEQKKQAASGLKATAKQNLDTIDNTIIQLAGVKAQVAGAQAALTEVQSQLAGTSTSNEGIAALTNGINQIQAGVGTYDETEINTAIASGNNTVCSALYQIQSGTETLSKGTNDLSAGLNTLKGKSKDLNDGVSTLADGTQKLAEGTTKLKDATVTLNDGVGELNAGAVKLNDGMIEFNAKGISKVTDAFDENSDNLLAEFKKLIDLGKDYKSFAGKSDDYDGNVIFIYKMDGIE